MESDAQMARDLQAAMSSSESDSSYGSEDDPPVPGVNRPAEIQNDEQQDDLEDQMGIRLPFNRSSFKRMLVITFNDYYPGIYNIERFKLEEYIKVIEHE